MTSYIPKRRLQQLGEQLAGLPAGCGGLQTFENIPKVQQVAPDSTASRVKSKVVIVTGANSPLGIGRASAHQFAQNGARAIFLCDIDDSFLAVHEREIRSIYPNVDVLIRQFDVADEAAMKSLTDEALERYGRLDIMFANAGTNGTQKSFTNIERDAFMKTMTTNVLSVFLATKYAANAMLATSSTKPSPSGSIIATASVAGLRSNAGPADYSASKAAVISLMQTAAYQLPHPFIRCNAICPALIKTGMTDPVLGAGARARGTAKKLEQLSPMGRSAVADEVARVALFLGSDEASHVNGQAWSVCGGYSAGHPFINTRAA